LAAVSISKQHVVQCFIEGRRSDRSGCRRFDLRPCVLNVYCAIITSSSTRSGHRSAKASCASARKPVWSISHNFPPKDTYQGGGSWCFIDARVRCSADRLSTGCSIGCQQVTAEERLAQRPGCARVMEHRQTARRSAACQSVMQVNQLRCLRSDSPHKLHRDRYNRQGSVPCRVNVISRCENALLIQLCHTCHDSTDVIGVSARSESCRLKIKCPSCVTCTFRDRDHWCRSKMQIQQPCLTTTNYEQSQRW
jgi:hypothetical protein